MDVPIYSIPGFADPLSSILHLVAASVFACAGPFLVRRGRGDPARMAGLGVFAFSVVLLLTSSGIYHLLDQGTTARAVFQRMDYAAIFSLIAGSFTGIHVALFRGAWRSGMIALIWVMAAVGMSITVIFFKELPEWLSLGFYLGMGWFGLVSCWKAWRVYGAKMIRLVIAGGLAYSVGAVLEFMRAPVLLPGVFGPHELFHMAVVVGVSCHWVFLYRSAQLLEERATPTPAPTQAHTRPPFATMGRERDTREPNELDSCTPGRRGGGLCGPRDL